MQNIDKYKLYVPHFDSLTTLQEGQIISQFYNGHLGEKIKLYFKTANTFI